MDLSALTARCNFNLTGYTESQLGDKKPFNRTDLIIVRK